MLHRGILRGSLALLQKNPVHESTPGQFDKSFEKVVEKLESTIPRNRIITELRGTGIKTEKDNMFGEIPYEEQKRQTQQDLWGKEDLSLGDTKRSIMFDAAEWDGRVREALDRAKKVKAQQGTMDPKILKTSKETADYYYEFIPLEEKIMRRRIYTAIATVIILMVCYKLWRTVQDAMKLADPATAT